MPKTFIILIGLVVMAIVYVYIPSINPGSVEKEISNKEKSEKKIDNQNTFVKPEYVWKTGDGNSLIIKSEIAVQNKEDPHILDLKKVYSYSNLNDGTKIELKSGKAIYNRQSQNIVYYDKVKIENKDVFITSDNAEYVTRTSLLTLYGNVRVKKDKDYLISDTVIFNTKTKNLKFSMKDKTKKVYGKKTKN